MEFFLGIDDTDVLGHKPGTGRLARELAAELEQDGLGRLIGVVRHQLLIDPRIPYTSHNSPACIILTTSATTGNGIEQRLFDAAADFLTARHAIGSDPGLCLARAGSVTAPIIGFGYRASSEVVRKDEAQTLAAGGGVRLAELGGTGDGIIGALAAVGLTADGNGGRFLEVAGGVRDFGEFVTAGALRGRGISVLSMSRNGEVVPADAMIATGDRVRPRMIGGRPVLLVEPNDSGWRCFDRKDPHTDTTDHT